MQTIYSKWIFVHSFENYRTIFRKKAKFEALQITQIKFEVLINLILEPFDWAIDTNPLL